MRNGATTWRDHDRARNVSESRISQVSEADLGGPLPMSALGQKRRFGDVRATSALPPILLQKSKVASVRIFGETLKREAIDDSDNLNRVTEVAYEFSVRR
jgi:hypothetical protein